MLGIKLSHVSKGAPSPLSVLFHIKCFWISITELAVRRNHKRGDAFTSIWNIMGQVNSKPRRQEVSGDKLKNSWPIVVLKHLHTKTKRYITCLVDHQFQNTMPIYITCIKKGPVKGIVSIARKCWINLFVGYGRYCVPYAIHTVWLMIFVKNCWNLVNKNTVFVRWEFDKISWNPI